MTRTGSLLMAASASGLLPWIIAAALAASGALFGGGWWAGHRGAARACEVAKFQSHVAAQTAQARAVAKAQATSDRIWAIGTDLSLDLQIIHTRAESRIAEVTRHVDAAPDLARCLLPAAVGRVRAEQVRDSLRIATGQPVHE